MDWDDEKYSREEISQHLDDLGVELGDGGLDELLARTTKNTRTGNEFGFKPTELSIGTCKGEDFYCGFSSSVDRDGVNIHTKEQFPSSFWVRFREEFQLRAFCTDLSSRSFSPYECHIPFRDIVASGIRLHARYLGGRDARVLVHLIIKSRKPARYHHYLERVVTIGNEPIFERHATEADFFTNPVVAETLAGTVYSVGDPRLLVHPGLWLVHCLTFIISLRQYKLLWMCMMRLRLAHVDADIMPPNLPLPNVQMPDWPSMDHLDYPTRYLVEGLLSYGTVTVPEVHDLLTTVERYRPNLRLTILEGLFRWAGHRAIKDDVREVARRVNAPSKQPDHLIRIRRCLITPTRCLLNLPVPETSNALIRAFQPHLDLFIRVQFVDDDGDFPVTGETLCIDDELQGTKGVFARIRRALGSGILIAGRVFKFLTFGESQVRERGVWMISESEDLTVDKVLAWMGDLSQERIVAKHAARQGLALSTTRHLNMPLNLQRIDDISRNGYIFTDGSGECTQRLIDRCARLFGSFSSSAVQGRIGGTKGVWQAVSPEEEMKMNEDEVRVRDSQRKFPSDHDVLSVIKAASYSRATLNRQAILLLESRGVQTDVLVRIFCDEKARVENYENTFGRASLAAISTFPIADIRHACISDDPIVEDVYSVIRCRLLSDLKWKAWIEVALSAFLMGVSDATDNLEEDQVFCQIHPPGGSSEVITGRLHPGDVRTVNAVDCPRLRHLKNVIVFSTHGNRDIPNMLSGGDLDGDFYSLLWDPRLQIPTGNVHPPMDYTQPPPRFSPHPVTVEQTKEYFLDFIRNDVLGRICNTHMALADQHGPEDPQCIELARLASQAVDFSKTGVPVDPRSIPLVSTYPDYMGKEYKSIRHFKKQPISSYASAKALGRMFREIDPEPEFKAAEDCTGDPFIIALDEPEGYGQYLEKVVLFKAQYDFQLEGLLRRYDITEAECVAGLLLRSPKTRFKVEKDFDLRVAVREAFQLLTAAANDQANSFIEENPLTGETELDRKAWALASYKVTHDPELATYRPDWSQIDLEITEEDASTLVEELTEFGLEAHRKLYSYPWLFSKELLTLKEIGGNTL